MKIAVLGTGGVGVTIATALIDAGHEVRMGSRSAANPKAVAWVAGHGASASEGSFRDTADFGEVVFKLYRRVSVPRRTARGRSREPGRQDSHRSRESARLLEGHASRAHRLQYRFAR